MSLMLLYSADHGHTVVDEWWTDDVQIEEIQPEVEDIEDTYSGFPWDFWM